MSNIIKRHVQRMNMGNVPQLIMNWKLEGKKERRRLRKRWNHKLMGDIVENVIDEEDTQDRKGWKQKLKDFFS